MAARSELARQIDAAAMVLSAGRDLLHTHLANDARGARQFRSEWGLVVCSPPAERALLAELAWLAHQIAAPCTDVALAARSPDTADARRALRAACGWLRAFSGSVQAAPIGPPRSPPPIVTYCSPSRSTRHCPALSWTAANRSPPFTTP